MADNTGDGTRTWKLSRRGRIYADFDFMVND